MIKVLCVLLVILLATASAQTINWTALNITISTEEQLRQLAQMVSSGQRNFTDQTIILGNNITLSNEDWAPIGRIGSDGTARNTAFNGTFNGNGKVIRNLRINTSGSDQGLFGISTGTIKNLGVFVNIRLSSPGFLSWAEYIGGLVGRNVGGTIQNSYTSGRISGRASNVGGLVGANFADGVIRESYSVVNIDVGHSNVGGLAGHNIARIENSFAVGNLRGSSIGGLVGSNGADIGRLGTIRNSYFSGTITVSSPRNAGGLAGSNNGVISNSFALANAPELLLIGDHTLFSNSGTLTSSAFITAEQMKQQNNFSGWNFNSVWAITPNINNGFPYLKNVAVVANEHNEGFFSKVIEWIISTVNEGLFGIIIVVGGGIFLLSIIIAIIRGVIEGIKEGLNEESDEVKPKNEEVEK
jgi:hypothetical protein